MISFETQIAGRAPQQALTSLRLLLMVLCGLLPLAGCAVDKTPFALHAKEARPAPGSLAVIYGKETALDKKIAAIISQELATKSAFRIMSQNEISRRTAYYPPSLLKDSPARVLLSKSYIDYYEIDKDKVDALQRLLKTDYIFVVWHEDIIRHKRNALDIYTMSSTKSFSIEVAGNLIAYPHARVIGFTEFDNERRKSCFFFSRSESDDIDALTQDTAREIATALIVKTGTARTAAKE